MFSDLFSIDPRKGISESISKNSKVSLTNFFELFAPYCVSR